MPPPGDLPDPEMEPGSSALQAASLLSEPPGKPEVKMSVDLLFNPVQTYCHSIKVSWFCDLIWNSLYYFMPKLLGI